MGRRDPTSPARVDSCAVRGQREPTGFDTHDLATQQGTSHHYTRLEDGTYRYAVSNFRYLWPAECDLMARLAGLEPAGRWEDWDRSPFTSESTSHISLWRKPHPAE